MTCLLRVYKYIRARCAVFRSPNRGGQPKRRGGPSRATTSVSPRESNATRMSSSMYTVSNLPEQGGGWGVSLKLVVQLVVQCWLCTPLADAPALAKRRQLQRAPLGQLQGGAGELEVGALRPGGGNFGVYDEGALGGKCDDLLGFQGSNAGHYNNATWSRAQGRASGSRRWLRSAGRWMQCVGCLFRAHILQVALLGVYDLQDVACRGAQQARPLDDEERLLQGAEAGGVPALSAIGSAPGRRAAGGCGSGGSSVAARYRLGIAASLSCCCCLDVV